MKTDYFIPYIGSELLLKKKKKIKKCWQLIFQLHMTTDWKWKRGKIDKYLNLDRDL